MVCPSCAVSGRSVVMRLLLVFWLLVEQLLLELVLDHFLQMQRGWVEEGARLRDANVRIRSGLTGAAALPDSPQASLQLQPCTLYPKLPRRPACIAPPPCLLLVGSSKPSPLWHQAAPYIHKISMT